MHLKPKREFFEALKSARLAVGPSDSGEESDSSTLEAVLAKGEKSEGITYHEFEVCCKLFKSSDPDWSPSRALDGCEIEFLKPVIPPRNPELEARVQRLKREQANRKYKEMVKNVDHALLKDPTETVGAQLKQLRVQTTNVVQLILTVVGTFVFAFKLVEYNLDGATLIDKVAVGLATALLVGFCDFYFVMRQMCAEDAKLVKKD